MARLELSDDGCSFLDVLVVDDAEGFGAIVLLKVAAARSRSGLLVRDEVSFNQDPKKLQKYIERGILTEGSPARVGDKLEIHLERKGGVGVGCNFHATWKDARGCISFECIVDEKRLARFRNAIRDAIVSVTRRNGMR